MIQATTTVPLMLAGDETHLMTSFEQKSEVAYSSLTPSLANDEIVLPLELFFSTTDGPSEC
jgi:hypothetical protein